MASSTHSISLEKAKEMTVLFRKQKESILDSSFRDQNILPISETFNRDIFDSILAQTGCTNVRLYFGMNAEKQVRLIVVGVNTRNEDILPAQDTPADDDSSNICEEGQLCPPFCASTPL